MSNVHEHVSFKWNADKDLNQNNTACKQSRVLLYMLALQSTTMESTECDMCAISYLLASGTRDRSLALSAQVFESNSQRVHLWVTVDG